MNTPWEEIEGTINCMISKIERLILEEVKAVKINFPWKLFADTKNIGDLGLPNVIRKQAICLRHVDEFCGDEQCYHVILTPEGIYSCRVAWCVSLEEQKNVGELILKNSLPDWSTRHLAPYLWLKYKDVIKYALEELKRGQVDIEKLEREIFQKTNNRP